MEKRDRVSDGMAALIAIAAGTFAVAGLMAATGALLGPHAVADASMTPALPEGALLLIEARDPSELQAGDIVSIRTASGTVTRRVIAVDSISAGQLATLKADTSGTAEAWGVMYAGQADVVDGFVPYLGYIAENAWAVGGALVIVVAIAATGIVLWRRTRHIPSPVQLDETLELRLPAQSNKPMKAAL